MRCGSDTDSVLLLLISTEAEGGGGAGCRSEGVRDEAEGWLGGKIKEFQYLFRIWLLGERETSIIMLVALHGVTRYDKSHIYFVLLPFSKSWCSYIDFPPVTQSLVSTDVTMVTHWITWKRYFIVNVLHRYLLYLCNIAKWLWTFPLAPSHGQNVW